MSLAVMAPAAAAPVLTRDQKLCVNIAAADSSISGCSRLIAAGRPRLDLANVYNNRGAAYINKGDYDLAVRDLDESVRLNPKLASAYTFRALAYYWKSQFERAIADYTEALRLDPKSAVAYSNRGTAYQQLGDHDRAIADFSEAIQRNPKLSTSFGQRAVAYSKKRDYDRAERDLDEALRLSPKDPNSYLYRGMVYLERDDPDRALREFEEAARLGPKQANVYSYLGVAYGKKGEHDRALRELDEAIRLSPKEARIYMHRARAYRAKGDLTRAHRDIIEGLALNPTEPDILKERETIRALMAQPSSSAPVAAPPPPPAAAPVAAPVAKAPVAIATAGPRVALVVGNGRYRSVPALANPVNDARDMAAVLRELGFKVIEGYDLDSAGMRATIGEFGASMQGATTTLFFYAGHGIQVAGHNYLIPIDARLERPSALDVEAIRVSTILADMETEKRINLVFLDACRDNPMSRSLAQSLGAGRSTNVGQGLAQVNAGIGTLITFATSPDRVALDGSGRNSPFTAALLKHIRTPNLEVRSLLTRVRADVIEATNERQVPWDHSSLTGEFYFKFGS